MSSPTFTVSHPLLADPEQLLKVEFRHHGLGMLQGYLAENVRVHVWHPALCADWTSEPLRAVHDHRYDLRSTVLFGELLDVSYDVQLTCAPLVGGEVTHLWEIVNAKAQRERGLNDDMVAIDRGPVRAHETGRRFYRMGESYTIPRRAFHTTQVSGLAVTVVERSNFDSRPARVLGKTGRSAITWENSELARQVVEAAVEALLGVDTHPGPVS